MVLQLQSPPCPLLRESVLLCLTAEYGSSSPGVPKCSEFTDTVVTTSPFLLSPHKVLERRGSSSQHLQILHHSACALVALADIPSHGFSSHHTLWGPGLALSLPLSCQKGPAQPPVGLRDPTPPPLSRHEKQVLSTHFLSQTFPICPGRQLSGKKAPSESRQLLDSACRVKNCGQSRNSCGDCSSKLATSNAAISE